MGTWLRILLALGIVVVLFVVLRDSGGPAQRADRPVPEAATAGEAAPEPVAAQKSLDERIREIEGEGEERDPEARVATIASEEGDPIEGAAFQFGGRVFTSDASGRVEFLWAEDEPELEFDIRHPAFIDLVETRRDTGEDLSFVLRRGHTLRGQVVFPDGTPMPEAEVRIWTDETTDRPVAITDRQGAFAVTGVPDCRVDLTTKGVRGRWGSWSPGDPPVRLVMSVPWILLRIVDPDGRPVANAHVRVVRRGDVRMSVIKGKQVGARGIHGTVHRADGPTKYVVQADGYQPHTVVAPPAPPAPALWERRVELVPFEPVPVYLLPRRPDGTPAPSVVVDVVDADADVVRRIEAAPKEDQPIRVDAYRPGRMRIRVWQKPDYLLYTELEFVPGKQTLRVDLLEGGRIFVPMAPATSGTHFILVQRIGGGEPLGLRFDRKSGGYRSASRVPAGRYRAEVRVVEPVIGRGGPRPPAVVSHRTEIEVRAGEEARIDWKGTEVQR